MDCYISSTEMAHFVKTFKEFKSLGLKILAAHGRWVSLHRGRGSHRHSPPPLEQIGFSAWGISISWFDEIALMNRPRTESEARRSWRADAGLASCERGLRHGT